MYDYKQEIIDTRKGCLGSSDGRILSQISTLGYVPKSAYKRMAVLKSLIEHKDIPKNDSKESLSQKIQKAYELQQERIEELRQKNDEISR